MYNLPLSSSVPVLSREFVVRRISEGETGRLKEELKCEACGKGYKHISSLAKHLWEHTPEWNVTKKLLISKHQQVQLLEAASILVGMNETSSSRRNSTAYTDQMMQHSQSEDPRYKSPFSPSNSAETNPTSHTPTPPAVGNVESERKAHSLKFKNAFDPESVPSHVPSFDVREDSKVNYNRTHSISQYPPVDKSHSHLHSQTPSSPSIGGYLDNPRAMGELSRRRSSSVAQNGYEHDLKSPSPSYKAAPSIPTSTTFAPSTLDTSPRIDEADEKVDHEHEETSNSFDEGVLGKMED